MCHPTDASDQEKGLERKPQAFSEKTAKSKWPKGPFFT